MVKLYFLGGGDKADKVIRSNYRKIIKSNKNPSLLLLAWATDDIEKMKYYKPIMFDFFRSLGVNKIIYADINDSYEILKRKIKKSNMLYIPGGLPDVLLRNINKKKIGEIIKKYDGTIFGSSAGALVFCDKYIILRGQDGEPKTKFVKGLGLANISVSVHYRSLVKHLGGETPVNDLRIFSKKRKIYSIPEESMIYYDGNIKVFGKVYLFDKGKKIRVKN